MNDSGAAPPSARSPMPSAWAYLQTRFLPLRVHFSFALTMVGAALVTGAAAVVGVATGLAGGAAFFSAFWRLTTMSTIANAASFSAFCVRARLPCASPPTFVVTTNALCVVGAKQRVGVAPDIRTGMGVHGSARPGECRPVHSNRSE